jgi:hypothetical protein
MATMNHAQDVVDVEFILGEKPTKKISERLTTTLPPGWVTP